MKNEVRNHLWKNRFAFITRAGDLFISDSWTSINRFPIWAQFNGEYNSSFFHWHSIPSSIYFPNLLIIPIIDEIVYWNFRSVIKFSLLKFLMVYRVFIEIPVKHINSSNGNLSILTALNFTNNHRTMPVLPIKLHNSNSVFQWENPIVTRKYFVEFRRNYIRISNELGVMQKRYRHVEHWISHSRT